MALQQLKVGAAKRCISPTLDMLPLPNMRGSYTDIRTGEDLMVRAIIIDNGERVFLLESWELAAVPCDVELREKIEQRYGIKQENMLLFGTHNHHSPFVGGGGPPKTSDASSGPDAQVQDNTRRFTELVKEMSLEVVGAAMENMRPARYGYGEGKSYINVNRDQFFFEGYWMQGINFEGCSDKTLAMIKFVDDEGKLIAALMNYAMHSNTSFCALDADGKMKVTSDIPGIACNFVEEYFGNDAVVMWQSGAAGNQNPYYMGGMSYYDKTGTVRMRDRINGAGYEQAVVFGQQHAIDAIRVLKDIENVKPGMRITTVDSTIYFPGQTFPENVDRGAHRVMVDNLQEWAGQIPFGAPMPEKHLVDMIPSDEKVPMKAQLVLLGDIAIYGVACELYNEIAVLCKEASPFKHTMIATHIGTPSVGYVLDDASKDKKVFQSFGAVRPGQSNGIVVNGMLDMFEEALAK